MAALPGPGRRVDWRASSDCWCVQLPAWPCGRHRTQPQRRLGRLHRVLDDGEKLDGERLEVDLLAQAGGECFHGAGGVVAAAELPVDHVCTRALRPVSGSSTRGTAALTPPQPT